MWLRLPSLGAFCIVLSVAVPSTCFEWYRTASQVQSQAKCVLYGFGGASGAVFILGVGLILIGIAIRARGWGE